MSYTTKPSSARREYKFKALLYKVFFEELELGELNKIAFLFDYRQWEEQDTDQVQGRRTKIYRHLEKRSIIDDWMRTPSDLKNVLQEELERPDLAQKVENFMMAGWSQQGSIKEDNINNISFASQLEISEHYENLMGSVDVNAGPTVKSCTKRIELNRVELCTTIGAHDTCCFHPLTFPLQCDNGMAMTITLEVYPFPSTCRNKLDQRHLLVRLQAENSGKQCDDGCYALKVAITPQDEQGLLLLLKETTKETIIPLTSDSNYEDIIMSVLSHDVIIYHKSSIVRLSVKASLICINTSKGNPPTETTPSTARSMLHKPESEDHRILELEPPESNSEDRHKTEDSKSEVTEEPYDNPHEIQPQEISATSITPIPERPGSLSEMMHAPDDVDVRSETKESDRNHLEPVSNNDGSKLEGEDDLPGEIQPQEISATSTTPIPERPGSRSEMMHAPDDVDVRSETKESDRNHLEPVSNNDGGKLEGEDDPPGEIQPQEISATSTSTTPIPERPGSRSEMMHAPDDVSVRSETKESDRNHLEPVSNNDGGKLEGEDDLPGEIQPQEISATSSTPIPERPGSQMHTPDDVDVRYKTKESDRNRLEGEDLSKMLRILLPVSENWMNIGTMLALSDGQLTAIKTRCRDVSDNCLREMLNEWLQQTDSRPTKSALVDAVELYNPSLAEKISAL